MTSRWISSSLWLPPKKWAEDLEYPDIAHELLGSQVKVLTLREAEQCIRCQEEEVSDLSARLEINTTQIKSQVNQADYRIPKFQGKPSEKLQPEKDSHQQ